MCNIRTKRESKSLYPRTFYKTNSNEHKGKRERRDNTERNEAYICRKYWRETVLCILVRPWFALLDAIQWYPSMRQKRWIGAAMVKRKIQKAKQWLRRDHMPWNEHLHQKRLHIHFLGIRTTRQDLKAIRVLISIHLGPSLALPTSDLWLHSCRTGIDFEQSISNQQLRHRS